MCVHRPFFICRFAMTAWNFTCTALAVLLCCLTPYFTLLSHARTTLLISRRGTSTRTCINLFHAHSATAPPHGTPFSHLSVSQKNRTPPPPVTTCTVRSVASHLACKVLTPHTYLSFLIAHTFWFVPNRCMQ